jgi:hypothetical protein
MANRRGLQKPLNLPLTGTPVAASLSNPFRSDGSLPAKERPMIRYFLIGTALLVSGYFTLDRVDKAIAQLGTANQELVKANAQLVVANRQIAEMQGKLAVTCDKIVAVNARLDLTNANITLTNNKFDETNSRLIGFDQVMQKFTPWRK